MSSEKPLLQMRTVPFPGFEGAALEPEVLTIRLADSPVREHLEEMAKRMRLPKGVVGGHALAHLISQVDTKKAHEILKERAALIGKWGNTSQAEALTAPGPIISWIREAALRLNEDERAIVETAIELWYDRWPGKKKPKRAKKAA